MSNKKVHFDREKLEFLPAALEIEAAPPARGIRAILWGVVSFLFISIVWACWAKIDIVANATGKLVPSGKVKVVQSLEGGVISAIYVKEGQKVLQGDSLIQLDGTRNQAELERIENELQELKIGHLINTTLFNAMESFSIEHYDLQINITREIDEEHQLSSKHSKLLESAWSAHVAKRRSLLREIERLGAERVSLLIEIDRIRKTLPLVVERELSYESLLASSAVSKNQYLELKQQRIDQQENKKLQESKLSQIDISVKSAKDNLFEFLAESKKEIQVQLSESRVKINAIQKELSKVTYSKELSVLRSPVDGVVENLIVNTVGGVITSAQELMFIVPTKQSLEVQANLLNKDIGFVEVGQPIEIKIDSFPFTKYGVIHGTIEDISIDAIEDEKMGLLFPLRGSMQKTHININNKTIKLQSGMTVSIGIKTGQRRLIEFLLAPLVKTTNESMGER